MKKVGNVPKKRPEDWVKINARREAGLPLRTHKAGK